MTWTTKWYLFIQKIKEISKLPSNSPCKTGRKWISPWLLYLRLLYQIVLPFIRRKMLVETHGTVGLIWDNLPKGRKFKVYRKQAKEPKNFWPFIKRLSCNIKLSEAACPAFDRKGYSEHQRQEQATGCKITGIGITEWATLLVFLV